MAGLDTMPCHKTRVAFFAELLRRWRCIADFLGARDATAFLINGDNGWDVTDLAEGVCEFAYLLWAFYITTKEHKTTGLNATEVVSLVSGKLGALDAEQEKLAVHGGTLG